MNTSRKYPWRLFPLLFSSHHQATHVRTICSYCDLPGSLITSAINQLDLMDLVIFHLTFRATPPFMGIKRAHPPQIAGLRDNGG